MFFIEILGGFICNKIKMVILASEVLTGERVFLEEFIFYWSFRLRKIVGRGRIRIGENTRDVSVVFGIGMLHLVFSKKLNVADCFNVFYDNENNFRGFDISSPKPIWCYGKSFSERHASEKPFDYDFFINCTRIK